MTGCTGSADLHGKLGDLEGERQALSELVQLVPPSERSRRTEGAERVLDPTDEGTNLCTVVEIRIENASFRATSASILP